MEAAMAWTKHEHQFAGDEQTMGICDGCHEPVRYRAATGSWHADPDLRVVVLPEGELFALLAKLPEATAEEVRDQLKAQDDYSEIPLRNA
jgi:hypothetical protein